MIRATLRQVVQRRDGMFKKTMQVACASVLLGLSFAAAAHGGGGGGGGGGGARRIEDINVLGNASV